MNSPFRVAQNSHADSQPTRVITITKPNGGEAVVVNLSHDGKVKLDLSAIANEKITIVKVPSGEPGGAEKAIILFDNQSTITIDPFFFGGQFPLNLTVELNAQQHDLTPGDFASLFPVTDDQSILPAGGDGGPAAGAEFSNPSVDPLAPSNPLPLLGPEELPNWVPTTELANLVVDDTPTFDAGQSFLLDEDALTNPPALRAGNADNALGDDDGGQSFSGTLHYDFKHDGPAGVDPIMVNVSALNALNLTSGNQAITFVWDATTFTLTGVINQGQPNETAIIKLQIDPATATSAGNDHPFTLELLGPLDHQGHDDPSTAATETSFEDNIVLHLDFTLTDSNGTVTPGTVDINIDDDSPVLIQQPAETRTVDEDDIATPWSLGTSPNTNLEGGGDQSVTQGGGGLVHPAVVTGSAAGLVAFGADGEGGFGFSADAISYFKSLNLFSKQAASPENGISLDYSVTQDAVNHTITLHAYEPDTVTPGITGNPVFDFVLDTQTGDFTFKLYDELIHTPGNGENTDLRSGGPGYYDAGNDGFAEGFLDAANAPAQGSIPYLDFGHIITATDGDGDTITLDGQVQIIVKDDVPEAHIFVNPFGVVQHDETAGTQGPSFADPADSDTSSSTVRNLFSSLETNHAGELGNDTDVTHTPSGGPAIGYAHSVLPVVANTTINYGADFPPESAVFSLQVADGTYSGVKTTEGYNVYLYEVDGYIVGRVGGNGVPGSQGDASDQGTIAFAITIEQGGNIDVAQYLSLQHPNTSSNDEDISLTDGAIQAVLTITDSDGDPASAAANIGSHIRFDDDGPKLIGRGESYTADEDDILDLQSVGSHPNDGNSDGSFTGAPVDNIAGPAYLSGSLAGQVNFGADGPAAGGGFSFKAETITTLEGYGLTSKGGDLSYTMLGDTLVAYVERVGSGYNPVLDRTVFTLELDSNGQFEFKLYDQLDHVYGNNGENTQLAGSNGPINNLNFGSLIIATDGDGDSVAFNGRLTITITDDVPHIIDFHETGAGVTIDETGGNNNNNVTGLGLLLVAPQFSGVENVGHDSDMNGGNPVYAANVAGVVTGAALSGADESLTSLLTLQLNGPVAANGGVDSHLQTTDNKEIYLFVENGLIVGRIDGDNNGTIDGSAQNSPDVAAFAINISQLGQLSIAQYLSLHHDNPNNPDDRVSLIDDLIQVKLTVTDFDGDQDSRTLNIGDAIRFDDDGPRVISRATVSAEADEDGLNNVQSIGNADTGQFGETGPTPALAVVNGVAGALNVLVNFGADGPGTPAFVVKDAAPTDSGLLSQGGHVMVASDGGVVRGYVDAGANDGYQVGDRLVFTLTVGGDGSYTFTLVDQIDHPTRDGLSGDDTENLLASSIDLSRYISAQDGDNDPVDLAAGSFKIQIRDDIPVVLARDAAETTVTETHTIDYTLHAGNVEVRGIGQGGHDILVTGVDINEGDNTVNTNSGKIGIGDGQSVDGYEVKGPNESGPEILTMQFVNNLDLGTNTFDSHDPFPSVKFSVDVAEQGPGDNPAVIFISATNHDDGANTDSFVGLTFKVNDVAVPATAVFDNGVLVGYVLDGVPDNATIEAIGASNFNILQVGNYNNFEFESTAGGATTTLTDGNSFKVYGIETEVTTTTVTTETFTVSEDESAGLNNAADPNAADDVNAPANGTDAYNVLFAADAIGYAKSGESVLITDNDFTALFTGSVGADEKPGGGGSWSFAITDSAGHSFNGTDSGLTTLDGTHILLTTDATTGALIGKAGNAEVFKVYVDSDGYVWISQYQAIHNDLAGSTDNAFDDIATVTVDGGLHIKATLTDFDHDSTSAVSEVALVVRFQDDGPLAVDDFDTVAGMTATGNVIDGTNEVTPGVDHVGTDGATVTDVSSNNEPDHNTTVNAGVLTIIGQYGTLELHPNGDYTYTRSDGAALIADDVFTYTLTDGDGDTSTAELTISIHDTGPTPTTATVGGNVDEDSLSNPDVDGVPLRPGEVDGAALGWSAISNGNLAPLFNPGDGTPLHFSVLGSNAAIDTLTNQNLTSGGAALSYAVSGDTLTAYVEAGGGSGYQSGTDTPVFTLQIADDGSYTFTLLNEVDHPAGGNNENTLTINLGGVVHVEDSDGDPADASGPVAFQITVLDDMPSIALTGGNLITDGDFAGGPGDFPLHVNEWQPGSGADTDGITGWTVTGSPVNTAGFVELERVGDGYLGMHTSTHGAMIDMAASPGNIAIAQTVTGTLGQTYAIQFEAGAPFPTTAQLQVYWGGQLIGTIDPTGPMTSYNYVVTANGGPQTLEFREVGDVTSPTPGAADGGYHGTYLANVAMIPVSIVDEDGLNPNGNHDLPTPSVGDAQVPDTDGDHNEATTTGALNITWGVDDTNGGVDGTAADSGFVQDGANAATLTGRSVTFTNDSVGVSGGIPLTSHGDAVTFVLSQNNTVLTGMAGGREVFSVSLSDDGSGAYRFILKDRLDHAPNGDENDITLTFNFTATDFDGDSVNSHFAVGVDDDVPVLTVDAGDHPQSIALALDETVEQNYTNNPGYDRYNGAETESAPGASNGGADDVTAGAGPVYNHTPVIALNPAASQAIGSLTTAAGVIGSQFGVHVSFGADGPAAGGGLSEHLGFALSSTSVATNLIATNTGAPELAGFVSDASRAISLVQVSDSVIEGRIVGDPNNANDDYVAFRLTLNNASDPANASITVDQFMAIQQDDHTKFDENTVLKLAQGSLDLKLDVVATDGDQDSTPVKSFTVNLANSDGSVVSFDDDGPAVKGVIVTDNLGTELIQNGSFELGHGDIGSSDWSIYSVLLPGWSAGPDNIPFEVQTGGVGGMPAQDGNALIELDGDTQGNPAHTPQGTPNPTHTDATIQQTVATEAGETYQLSFWYAPRGGDGVNSSGLKVFFGGNEVYNIDPAPNPPAVWQLITIQVTATSASSVLAFQGTGGENEFGAFLDNVSLKQIIPLDDEQTNALGIAGGPGDDGNGVVATGKIDFDAGTDGLKSIELHGPASLKAIYVDANGIGHSEDVSFQWTANGTGGTLLGTMNTPDGVKNVLTVTVDGSGNYTLTLLAPLDHPGHNDPSTPATEISFEDNIDLGIGFTVTDGDGDQAAGTLHFNVDDDSPNALAGSVNAGEVYEDGLKTPGDLSNGNAEPPALQPVSVVVTAAALANFVAAGADGLQGFGLNAGATGTVLTSTGADLKSDGVVVTYAVDNGTGDVLGMAGNREVFRLHDNGDGTFTFTLNDQIDHIPNVPADNDSQTLDINIVSAFTATDGDGDSVPLNLGSLNITVEDDIPFFAGEPYSLAVTHTGTVYSGSVDFHVGADEPGQFSITPPAINGVTTQTSTDAQSGIVTVTGTFTDGGNPYYVFTFNPATGGYTFDLENLPTTVTPLANVSTKGAFAPVQQKDFGDFTFIADAGHTINGSSQGTGVGDDNLENGEHLTVAFDTPRTVADFGLNFVGSGTLTVAWKAIDTATGNYETGTASITADGTLSIDVLNHVQPADADPLSNDITHFDKLELTATGPNSAKAKIITVGGSEVTEDHNPGPFVFNVTGSDFDGDKDSTTITVNANIAPAIPDPLGGDANTNILYQQIMIPLAALLGHDGITPDTGITVTNVVGATVSGDFVVLPAAGPGSDTTFSYAFTDGTTTTDPASMTIHRVDQFLNGTSGKDFFIARDWGETVNAGGDNDLIIKAGATLNGGDGNDYLFGTGGNNILSGNGGDDYIVGYGGSNTLSGGDGNDFLAGHGGTNVLTGGAGNDVLYAQSTGSHNSSLDGGADNDTLYAGHYNGTTTMKGGTGNDTFEFLDYTIAPNPNAGAASTITDYNFSEDKVDLTGLLEHVYGQGNATTGDVQVTADPNNSSNAVVQIDVDTGAGQTWQSVVSLTGYNHAGNQVNVVLDHMTNQQHNYPVV